MARKLGIVHCRVCNGEIDRNTTEEGKDWIMRSKGWFYHKDCYDGWVAEKDNLPVIVGSHPRYTINAIVRYADVQRSI